MVLVDLGRGINAALQRLLTQPLVDEKVQWWEGLCVLLTDWWTAESLLSCLSCTIYPSLTCRCWMSC